MCLGSSSEEGPVLICGRSHGIISIFTLPSLCERSVVKYGHDHDVRAVHNIGGTPSYFSTGGFDGMPLSRFIAVCEMDKSRVVAFFRKFMCVALGKTR